MSSLQTPLLEKEFQDTINAYFWRVPGALPKYDGKVDVSFFDDTTAGTIFSELVRYHADFKKLPAVPVLLDTLRKRYPNKEDEMHMRTRKTIKQKIEFMQECDVSDHAYIEKQLQDFIQFKALLGFARETLSSLETRKYDPDLAKKARTALEAG